MKLLSYTLILIPVLIITLRVVSNSDPNPGVISELTYDVSYQYEVAGDESSYEFESFLPVDDIRQDIEINSELLLESGITISDRNSNKKITWSGFSASDTSITIRYSAKTKHVKYKIGDDLSVQIVVDSENRKYLGATETIQTDDPKIRRAVDRLKPENPILLRNIVTAIYDYVEGIPSVESGAASDASKCFEKGVCTEKGKSRLLTAMFRAAGIPSRVAGGLVLNDDKKGDTDFWTQAYIGEKWVTFDVERGHFAELPATHLEIFRGDYSLGNRFEGSVLDHYYDISRDRVNDYPKYALFDIWNLIDGNELPMRPVMVLLLLPLGAYIVAICTNVVGFKTYGVFLPVLIAFSFIDMGLIQGLIFFTLIIGLISLMSFPLERWGILHTPKIVCLLTLVAIYCLAAVKLFYVTGWVAPSATLTFPIIILTLIAERFAQKVEEESLYDALFIYGQTLIVTLSCYWILSASVIQHFFITFPEALIGIAGLSLLLGKWIGLQLFEYSRFSKIDKEISYVE